MKVDIYAHIVPPEIKDILFNLAAGNPTIKTIFKRIPTIPTVYDLDERFRIMDKFPDVVQVLTLSGFSVDDITSEPGEALDLAMRINDAMAELVYKYPDRFAAATAVLPMNDMDNALKELDRAINELKLRGVLLRIPVNGKPVDRTEFFPLYERMCRYNLPIWWHPQVKRGKPDYADEKESKYFIWHMWGLVYETTVSMTRLVMSGTLEKFPGLKIITHHCGAMVPFFANRIVNHYNQLEMRDRTDIKQGLTEPHIDYFRRFYNDTAILGNTPALMCAYAFFGAEHLLFGTDMPYDSQTGAYSNRKTIEAIEEMTIPSSDKKKIFEDNARNLLRLPV